MKIISKKIDDLIPYEYNPRNNESAIDYVADSIQKYGFINPIQIDKSNVIISGHTRYLASKKLGLKSVPCIVVDDISDDEIKAYRLFDNKTHEFSSWDFDKLKEEMNYIDASPLFDDVQKLIELHDEALANNEDSIDTITDDENSVIEVPRDDRTTNTKNINMSWNKYSIVMSDEEFERMSNMANQYFYEHGNYKGFFTELFNNGDLNYAETES